MAAATKKRVSSKRPKAAKKGKWKDLLQSLPGYDPYRDAQGCWFDGVAAQLAIDFFGECITHVEGDLAGQPFRLERWQQAYVANLFGWKRKDKLGREVRRYRKSLLYVPRKNGKTPFAAALALYVMFCDDERGQQNYMAAAEREQAGFLFRQARGMVESELMLSNQARIFGGSAPGGQSRSIVKNGDASFLKVLSADANTKHGQNSHFICIDELHAQPNRDLYDVLATSMASQNRKQPLMVMITTADFMRESICNEQYEYACRVRDGIISDATYLPCIYEALPADDWKSEVIWSKANPNLGVSVSLDYLRQECKVAQEVPGYENTFKRLHLNMRTEQDVRWLPMDLWDACNTPVDLDMFSQRDCFLGLDLANTLDIAALYAIFPPKSEGGLWYVWPWYWVPAEVCVKRERTNKTKYTDWIRRGFMVQTDGDVTDYSFIRAKANELRDRFHVIRLAFDPWNATQLATELMDDGIECVKFPQTISNYNEPCKKLEELLAARQIAHGGHPATRWMASNVAIHTDGRGYKMPSRKASTEKIDGIAALLMGLGVAIQEPAGMSERTGLTFLDAPTEEQIESKPIVQQDNLAWFGNDIDDD